MEGREKGGRGKEGGEQAGLWSYGQGAADQVSADFLEDGSNVTGEVMNLDDFLKELQHNEQQSSSRGLTLASPPPQRVSVFASIGRAPELKPRPVVPELITATPLEEQKPPIPQASVRPCMRDGGAVRRKAPSTAVREELEEREEEPRVKQERLEREDRGGRSSRESEGDREGYTSTILGNFSADDLRLATIPGQEEGFDPSTRRFSEDELKPQPIIRKRRKQFVPDELKNGKYWAKRNINNEAAKRSREARRLKENQIAMRARFLEEENNVLKVEVDDLKKENGDLRSRLENLEERINKMSASRRK